MPLLSRRAVSAAQGFGLTSSGKVKFSKQEYTTPGTYTFKVPVGNYAIKVTTVGAGGGGGGNNTSGNISGGTGGGSGGYYQNQTITVTSGESLTITVGTGGYGGNYRFNANYAYAPNNPGTYDGGPGGTTSIARGATVLYSATGGGGGFANQGGGNTGGAGGSPSGVAGTGTYDTGNCSIIPVNKGVNALSIGSGGNGGQCTIGSPGSNGFVSIEMA